MNNKLNIGLMGINGYYTTYVESYRAAAAIYGLNIITDPIAQVTVEKGLSVEGILKILSSEKKNHETYYSIYITDDDIKDEKGTRIFGIADPKLRIAVLSERRLASDGKLARERIMKEAAHLFGHFLGLGHCSDSGCIMSYASELKQVDEKYPMLCSNCQQQLKLFLGK
ncbi:MAG: hypothetical protein JRN10_01970 [Nitrososphaerota archaeon]|jgi:predicted Zn-dependent protease|nr:archaemetzincin [Nitrososphaerota archaeon]MDG6926878.1 hypothetical protein [Nitrososphaerota archaeon]MDG6930004.1 hypothetical protein [Nitrososphaerota archaeon]MDG6931955.1 hypothetical protein [Nitrososphaerota archaeon]MDG6943842.1 hypothetical protein [Nitrososphaerota archaeon]